MENTVRCWWCRWMHRRYYWEYFTILLFRTFIITCVLACACEVLAWKISNSKSLNNVPKSMYLMSILESQSKCLRGYVYALSQCHLNSFQSLSFVSFNSSEGASKHANSVKWQFRLCYLVCVWIRMWFVYTTFEYFPAFSISCFPFSIHFDSCHRPNTPSLYTHPSCAQLIWITLVFLFTRKRRYKYEKFVHPPK